MVDNLIPGLKDFSEISQEGRDALIRAGMANLGAGSAGRALIEHMDSQLADLHATVLKTVSNRHVRTARDIFLDLIGLDVNLPRLGIGPVTVTNIQKFYVPRGVLGDFTRGQPLAIAQGTRVSATNGQHPIYEVIPFKDDSDDYPVWRPGQSEIFVRTRSITTGEAANADAGRLVAHNLPHDFVLTTNVKAISSARAVESDESYRYRLFNAGIAGQGSNELAIERAALEEPDVDSILIERFTQGPGSLTVVVVPTKGAGSEDLVRRVETKVRAVLVEGESLRVRLAQSRELQISLRVFSVDDPVRVTNSVRESVLRYLGRLNAGDSFVGSSLIAEILGTNLVVISDVQLLALRFNGQPLPAQNIRLDTDEIFIVPSPAAQAIQIDVVTR